MRSKTIKVLIALSVAIVGLASAITTKTFSKDSDIKSVNIGFFPNITHSQALLGKNNGDFKKAFGTKYKINWKQFNAGSAEIEAFLAGEIDLGYIGPGPAINGYVKSHGELKIIGGATNAGAILVSRKGVTIKNAKELKGKKIAIPQFGNTQDLALRSILKENGLKDTTKGGNVEIIQAENPDIKVLFDKKAIDAALVPEPWGSRLIDETGAKIVLDYNQIWNGGKYPSAVVIGRTEFIKDNQKLVEKFLKTHIDLTNSINKNASVARVSINNELKALTGKALSNKIINSAFKRQTVTYKLDKEAVNELATLSYETGFLRNKSDISDIFDLSIINKLSNK